MEDVSGFVDYLVRKHGPLPEGAGKKIMLNECTLCHDLERNPDDTCRPGRMGADAAGNAKRRKRPFPTTTFRVLLNYSRQKLRPQITKGHNHPSGCGP